MKMTLVGLFDRKAQVFINLEPTPAIGVATRQFTSLVNTPSESPIHKWPEDFEMYELGSWDSESGIVQHTTDEGGTYTRKLIITGDQVKVR